METFKDYNVLINIFNKLEQTKKTHMCVSITKHNYIDIVHIFILVYSYRKTNILPV